MGKGLTYQAAGVDIEKGDALVDAIKIIAKRTSRPGILSGIGGFGAMFELPLDRYKNPILVTSTDGVGTKLKLAMMLKQHDTIGIDLVAMCVNDIICQGAEPLFFLDYFATGQLNLEQAETIIQGIGKGCELANTALIGGETAEMPGMYHGEDYDLAGFCVGVVEKNKIIDGQNVKPGDVLIGLASSGPHSNGYSLIRKVLQLNNTDLSLPLDKTTLGQALIEPTRIYVRSLLKLMDDVTVKAIAHITGGGLLENIPRVLPNNTQAIIDSSLWEWPEVFHWLQTRGNIAEDEMYRTFNVGIGMVICVSEPEAQNAIKTLQSQGETAMVIGHIEASKDSSPIVSII